MAKIRIVASGTVEQQKKLGKRQIKSEVTPMMKRKIINRRARGLYVRVQEEEDVSINRAIDTLRNKSIAQLQDEYQAYLR